jgi:hypothetical protein
VLAAVALVVPAFAVAGALALLVAEAALGAVAGDAEFALEPLASLCWPACGAGATGAGGVADAVASSKAANGCSVVICWVAAGCDHCGGV